MVDGGGCSSQTFQVTALDCVSVSMSLRVNGVVSSMEEFAEAFNCPLGSKMNPKQPRCRVW